MVNVEQILFSHREVAELLVKKQGLHEGIWTLIVEFQLGATVAGSPDTLLPAGVLGVSRIGLQRGTELNNLSVDAAVVNPGAVRKSTSKRTPKK